MNIFWITLYIHVVWLNECCTFDVCDRAVNQPFKREPDDVIATYGQDVTFTCTVSNFNSEYHSVSWRINPNSYNNFMSELFNQGTGDMTSTLTLYKVGKIKQSVQCILHVLDSDLFPHTCFSRTAISSIKEFPRADELLCTPSMTISVSAGDYIPIRCEVPKGNPAVSLSWRIERNNGTLPSSHDENDMKVLEHKLQMSSYLHRKSIICSVTSPTAFPGLTLSCSVGPFLMNQKPDVKISPTEVIAYNKSVINHLAFSCVGNGYPKNITYKWECVPAYLVEGCSSKTKITNISFLPNASSQTVVRVTCIASNDAGNSNASARILISDLEKYNPAAEICQIVTMSLKKENATCHSSHAGVWDLEMSFTHELSNEFECKLQVNWYVDHHLVLQNNSTSLNSTAISSTITLHNLTVHDIGKIVQCDVIEQEKNSVITSLNTSIQENPCIFRYDSSGYIIDYGKYIILPSPTTSSSNEQSIYKTEDIKSFTPNGGLDYKLNYLDKDKIFILTVVAVATSIILIGLVFTSICVVLYNKSRRGAPGISIRKSSRSPEFLPGERMSGHFNSEGHLTKAESDLLYEMPIIHTYSRYSPIPVDLNHRPPSRCDHHVSPTNSFVSTEESVWPCSYISCLEEKPDADLTDEPIYSNIYENHSAMALSSKTSTLSEHSTRLHTIKREGIDNVFPPQPPLPKVYIPE